MLPTFSPGTSSAPSLWKPAAGPRPGRLRRRLDKRSSSIQRQSMDWRSQRVWSGARRGNRPGAGRVGSVCGVSRVTAGLCQTTLRMEYSRCFAGIAVLRRSGGASEIMSVLPLRPFGVSDQVWPPGVCEACYDPEWSDALHDWEYVQAAAGPCGACRVLPVDEGRMPALLNAIASGVGVREGS